MHYHDEDLASADVAAHRQVNCQFQTYCRLQKLVKWAFGVTVCAVSAVVVALHRNRKPRAKELLWRSLWIQTPKPQFLFTSFTDSFEVLRTLILWPQCRLLLSLNIAKLHGNSYTATYIFISSSVQYEYRVRPGNQV